MAWREVFWGERVVIWDWKWIEMMGWKDGGLGRGDAGFDTRNAVGLSTDDLAILVDCSDDAACFGDAHLVISKVRTNSRSRM